jgi:hypothetical protein
MQNFGTKADNSPPPGGQLSAAEFNNLATENENAVSRSGQALSGASDTQLAQSLFLHAVKSESFQDSGAANAYVATPVSGTNGVLLPADYSNMNGAVILFKAANANSGASTLNIGQTTGTLLGAKAIVDQFGAAITSGLIGASYVELRYDSSIGAGSWVLLPWSSGGRLINIQTFTANGTYTPTPGMRSVLAEYVGGGGGSGVVVSTAAGQVATVGGGASGSYGKARLTAADIGASQVVTIGAAGVGGTAGSAGGNGGTTSLGGLLTAPGGGGSPASPGAVATSTADVSTGGVPGAIATGGNILTLVGNQGVYGIAIFSKTLGGTGGGSPLGSGGAAGGASFTATSGSGYGSGAGGPSNGASSAAKVGVAGTAGVIIIYEYS